MKNLILAPIVAVTIFFLSCGGNNDQFSSEKEAVTNSATTWLKQLDDRQYSQSWLDAGPSFKADMTKRQWEIGMKYLRTPYGGVISRKIKSCKLVDYDPQTGHHQLAATEFRTTFKDQKTVTEFVHLEFVNNLWRVSIYYLDR